MDFDGGVVDCFAGKEGELLCLERLDCFTGVGVEVGDRVCLAGEVGLGGGVVFSTLVGGVEGRLG